MYRLRGGGKVGIPARRDFQEAVGVVGNRWAVFHDFHRPVFSTALFVLAFRALDGRSIRGVTADHMRAETDRHSPVQVLVDGHRRSGERMPEAALLQLPAPLGNGNRVVLVHYPLGLHREHPVQAAARAPPRSRLGKAMGRT